MTLDQTKEWLPRLLDGMKFTVEITIGAFILALLLGLVIAMMRLNRRRWYLYVPATIYVEVLRGTPLILQLFYAYFALPSMGIRLSPLTAAILGLGINTSAYMSEIFRGSIRSVDKGQWEAGAALAMGWPTMMRSVILPQAMRIALPPTGNYAVSLFKDSALASTVSVTELMFTGQMIGSETFRYMEIYGTIGLLYLAVSYPTSLLLRLLETRLDLNRPRPRKKRSVPAPVEAEKEPFT